MTFLFISPTHICANLSLSIYQVSLEPIFKLKRSLESRESSRGWKIPARSIFLILTWLRFIHPQGFDAIQRPLEFENRLLKADFEERDQMPQTDIDKKYWFDSRYIRWGPPSKEYPIPHIPEGVDVIKWKQDRIIELAKRYIGLPYQRVEDGMRGHFPARGCGLDCSNFVAWVYNYGLGIKFSSNINELIENESIGRKLNQDEPFQKGDLIFLSGTMKHVVIYIDQHTIIHSTNMNKLGVCLWDTRLKGSKWCRVSSENKRFCGGKRLIE